MLAPHRHSSRGCSAPIIHRVGAVVGGNSHPAMLGLETVRLAEFATLFAHASNLGIQDTSSLV